VSQTAKDSTLKMRFVFMTDYPPNVVDIGPNKDFVIFAQARIFPNENLVINAEN